MILTKINSAGVEEGLDTSPEVTSRKTTKQNARSNSPNLDYRL